MKLGISRGPKNIFLTFIFLLALGVINVIVFRWAPSVREIVGAISLVLIIAAAVLITIYDRPRTLDRKP